MKVFLYCSYFIDNIITIIRVMRKGEIVYIGTHN